MELPEHEQTLRRLVVQLKSDWTDNPKKNADFRTLDWDRWGSIARRHFESLGYAYDEYLHTNDTTWTLGCVEKFLRRNSGPMAFFASAAASFAQARTLDRNRIEGKRQLISKLARSAHLQAGDELLLILTTVARDSGLADGDTEASSVIYGTAISGKRVRILRPWAFGSDLPDPNPRLVPYWR